MLFDWEARIFRDTPNNYSNPIRMILSSNHAVKSSTMSPQIMPKQMTKQVNQKTKSICGIAASGAQIDHLFESIWTLRGSCETPKNDPPPSKKHSFRKARSFLEKNCKRHFEIPFSIIKSHILFFTRKILVFVFC